jgi:hypothetical protein
VLEQTPSHDDDAPVHMRPSHEHFVNDLTGDPESLLNPQVLSKDRDDDRRLAVVRTDR